MTNKDYKRLTVWNEETQRPCMTAYFQEELFDTVARHVERLYELENAIEDGKLKFLPCKVEDSLWHIQHNLTIEEAVVDNVEVLCDGDTKIRVHFVNAQAGTTFYGSAMGKYYFTSEEAAKKALEKMKNVKNCNH